MKVAFLILFFLAIVLWKPPGFWKKEQKRGVFVYLALILLDLGLSISLVLHVDLPIISDGVIYLFQPLKEMVYGYLR